MKTTKEMQNKALRLLNCPDAEFETLIKELEGPMQAEAEKLLTCSEEEFKELTKDRTEVIERISKKMLSVEELIKIANARRK